MKKLLIPLLMLPMIAACSGTPDVLYCEDRVWIKDGQLDSSYPPYTALYNFKKLTVTYIGLEEKLIKESDYIYIGSESGDITTFEPDFSKATVAYDDGKDKGKVISACSTTSK